jgi:nucleoside-triphosphatase
MTIEMKNILLTGSPGVGKTTIVKKLTALLRPVAGGFLTEEIREKGKRLGFKVQDIHSGREGTLSHVRTKSRYHVGRYGIDLEDFETVGVKALDDALGCEGLIFIDEIGKMELFSGKFKEKLIEVLNSPHRVVATIRKGNPPFISDIKGRPDTVVINITMANREAIADEIVKMLEDG